MRKALTDALVRALRPIENCRDEVSDERCPGLVIRVTAAGVKSWSFRFRDPRSGRVTRATIGAYPDVSLARARERADELRREVAGGVNPVERRRRERDEAETKTFGALADRYLKEHSQRFKRSCDADERNLRLHILPKWRGRRYDELQRRDVIALCEAMVAAGTGTNANRVQALVSSIYSFAIDADLASINPCARLRKRGAENVGRRVLSDAEITLFWPRIILKPLSWRAGLALRLALLTGAGAAEVAEATRPEFLHLDDPERAAWLLPAKRSKNGREHFVPLAALARQTVTAALSFAGDGPFLFPSPSVADKPITAHALSVGMARFARHLVEDTAAAQTWKAEPPSPHDLRRTVATRLSSLGVPGEDVSAVLNHTRRDVTGWHYDLYDRAREKRRALEAWDVIVAGLSS